MGLENFPQQPRSSNEEIPQEGHIPEIQGTLEELQMRNALLQKDSGEQEPIIGELEITPAPDLKEVISRIQEKE